MSRTLLGNMEDYSENILVEIFPENVPVLHLKCSDIALNQQKNVMAIGVGCQQLHQHLQQLEQQHQLQKQQLQKSQHEQRELNVQQSQLEQVCYSIFRSYMKKFSIWDYLQLNW